MLIEALFSTNLFIFLYIIFLRFFNSSFPAELPTEFIRVGALPEPFEISLYLILSFILTLALFFLHKQRRGNQKIQLKEISRPTSPEGWQNLSILKYVSMFFLILLFISNLGAFPMARSIYPYLQPETASTYIFYLLIYLSIVLIFIFLSLKIKKPLYFSILILITIAVATFEPRFPIVGHDYSYFLGPIWEVVHGKTLYTQVPSQYGFLSILFFSLLYKLKVFNVAYLPAIVWILYIIQYFLCFFLIYKVSRSLILSVIGLFSIISVNYFSIYHLPASIPQTGPLRWIPVILSLFFLYKFKSLTSRKFIFIVALLSLWVLDSGISLILAYGFTLFLLLISRMIDLKAVFRSAIYLASSLLVIFFLINGVHLVFGYKAINIISVFAKLQQYAKAGFGMIPLDLQTYFWIVMLIYFASIIYFFRNISDKLKILSGGTSEPPSPSATEGQEGNVYPSKRSGVGKLVTESDKIDNLLLLFSANLSLFASVYFVGRSHPHNLFHLSLFPILNAFILLGLILKNNSNFKPLLFFLFHFSIFILFIVYPIYQRQEVMTKLAINKIERFKTGNILTPEWINFLEKKYKAEVDLIKESLPEKDILILSPDDTYLFYLTEKGDLMNDNSQITILTQKDMDASLENIYKNCPEKIVGDCTLFNKCVSSKPFTEVAFFSIQPIILNQIQTACKISFKPTKCTDQLCIAEVQK